MNTEPTMHSSVPLLGTVHSSVLLILELQCPNQWHDITLSLGWHYDNRSNVLLIQEEPSTPSIQCRHYRQHRWRTAEAIDEKTMAAAAHN